MEKQQARRCITRRNLFRLGAVVAGLGFMDAVGGVVPALAGNIGDTVWVTGDREIGAQTPYSGSFTYHTDGSSGDPVFCLEQNILNGTGNAYIVNLVGQRTGMYNHDGGGRVYMTWTQANVTDAALIQDWCYNASGYSGDDAYVACQGFIWSFCRCCGDYNAMATRMSYVPAKYQGRLAELISYIVKSRSVVDGVGLCYSKSNGDQWLARFYLSSPTTDVPVEKVWTGTGNEHYRPDSVTLHVQQTNGGGNRYDCTLNAANGWKGVFPGVVLNAGRTPTGWETTGFTVTEDAVKQFSPSVTGDVHSGFKVTNTLITPTGGLTVTKAWSGAGYQSYMPDQVTVHVRGSDGSDRQLTLTALSGWTASLDDLPVIADDGSLITYTVEEDPVEHFTPHVTGDAESGFTVTNEFVTPVSDVEVVKVWQGDGREPFMPDSVTVTLMGSDGSRRELTLTEAGGWKGSFSELPEVSDDGSLISYELSEQSVEHFASQVTGSASTGFIVTNTFEVPTSDIPVTKVWKGSGFDAYLPDSVTVTLTGSDGSRRELTLTKAGGWSGTFTEVPDVDGKGQTITYQLEEDAVTQFISSVAGSAGTGFTVTNTFVVPTTSVDVSKVWTGGDYASHMPSSVRVTLTGTDGSSRTLELTAASGWHGSFDDLPVQDDAGRKIDYALSEQPVKDFASSVTGDVESGFVVTNELQVGGGGVRKSARFGGWL